MHTLNQFLINWQSALLFSKLMMIFFVVCPLTVCLIGHKLESR